MIVRRFTAKATEENAKKYYAFFENKLVPHLRSVPGHRGALVFSRITRRGNVRITVLTFWDSMAAIAKFAGDSLKAAVEPEARELLDSFNDEVTHWALEVDALTD